MSQSIIYGIGRGELKLRPGLRFAMNDKGQWTGSAEFTCVQGDFATSAIQTRLKPGTRITELSASVPLSLSFLALDTFEATDEPGGFTLVSVTLKGYTENQWDFDNERTKTYSRNSTLQEETILNHPKFLSEVSSLSARHMIKQAMDGSIVMRSDSTASHLIMVKSGNALDKKIIFSTMDANTIKWFAIIVINGNHTYQNPRSEWTLNTAGRSPLTATQLAKLGYIDDNVPGNPGLPTGQTWLMTGITENIQAQGDGSNSYSMTWTSSGQKEWDDDIYTKST